MARLVRLYNNARPIYITYSPTIYTKYKLGEYTQLAVVPTTRLRQKKSIADASVEFYTCPFYPGPTPIKVQTVLWNPNMRIIPRKTDMHTELWNTATPMELALDLVKKTTLEGIVKTDYPESYLMEEVPEDYKRVYCYQGNKPKPDFNETKKFIVKLGIELLLYQPEGIQKNET